MTVIEGVNAFVEELVEQVDEGILEEAIEKVCSCVGLD